MYGLGKKLLVRPTVSNHRTQFQTQNLLFISTCINYFYLFGWMIIVRNKVQIGTAKFD
jgi:hypothetical protein